MIALDSYGEFPYTDHLPIFSAPQHDKEGDLPHHQSTQYTELSEVYSLSETEEESDEDKQVIHSEECQKDSTYQELNTYFDKSLQNNKQVAKH